MRPKAIKQFRRFKVESDEKGYCVSSCPYNKNILMGGKWCSEFCRFFMKKDAATKEVSCSFNPVIQITKGGAKMDITNILIDSKDMWFLKTKKND